MAGAGQAVLRTHQPDAPAGAIRTGTFGVNQGYTMDPFAPFGGVKCSGYGRELGREDFDLRTLLQYQPADRVDQLVAYFNQVA